MQEHNVAHEECTGREVRARTNTFLFTPVHNASQESQLSELLIGMSHNNDHYVSIRKYRFKCNAFSDLQWISCRHMHSRDRDLEEQCKYRRRNCSKCLQPYRSLVHKIRKRQQCNPIPLEHRCCNSNYSSILVSKCVHQANH